MADSPQIHCPDCNRPFDFQPRYLGKRVKCPQCKNFFTFEPAVEVAKPPPAQTPAAKKSWHGNADPDQKSPDMYTGLGRSSTVALLRHGPLAIPGILLYLLIGGFIKSPQLRRIFLWCILGVIGLFLLLFVAAVITVRTRNSTIPARIASAPPPFTPHFEPPSLPPPGGIAPTAESFAARFGADHVFTVEFTDYNLDRDRQRISDALLDLSTPIKGSWRMDTQNGATTLLFAGPIDFDTFKKSLSFGKILSENPAARSLQLQVTPPPPP